MSFHEVRFPEDISYGSSGGPKFKTTVFTLDSGYEQRNIDWSQMKAEYDVSQGVKTRAQMDDLRAFFYARRGRAYGFRFKDWGDYQAANQQIGVGDGTTKNFQMIKTYTSGPSSYARKLTKLVSGTFTAGVLVNSVSAPYTVDVNTGIITITTAPGAGQIVFVPYVEFDVPVRFDTDHLSATHDQWEMESWNSIPLVEVRV